VIDSSLLSGKAREFDPKECSRRIVSRIGGVRPQQLRRSKTACVSNEMHLTGVHCHRGRPRLGLATSDRFPFSCLQPAQIAQTCAIGWFASILQASVAQTVAQTMVAQTMVAQTSLSRRKKFNIGFTSSSSPGSATGPQAPDCHSSLNLLLECQELLAPIRTLRYPRRRRRHLRIL
jgi:hypothetical protein